VIAIIGAGCAGWAAAGALREYGFEGGVRLVGAEPLPPYERPVLSKAFLTDPSMAEPPTLGPELTGVELDLGTRVVAIDPEAKTFTTDDERTVAYDKLLLTMGASPRRLDLPGCELEGVHYLREVTDARALRAELGDGRRVVVIGGGVIGLEVAASANGIGCQVSVVELAQEVLARVTPTRLAEKMRKHHAAAGIEFHMGARPVSLVEGNALRVGGVALGTGEIIPADVVFVGIGASPRSDLASAAGLSVDDGVLVDEQLRSSDPNIFAAGDVARVWSFSMRRYVRAEQWRSAEAQGRSAAAAMLDRSAKDVPAPSMWSDQGDLHLQVVGYGLDDDAGLVTRGDLEDRQGLAYFAIRDRRLIGVAGVSRGAGVARQVRPAQALITSGVEIDPAALTDPRLDLRRLVRDGARAQRSGDAGVAAS
jgi:3-phenylpropionate/trans-cinnamate dioxygenase ferredoxin reductase component